MTPTFRGISFSRRKWPSMQKAVSTLSCVHVTMWVWHIHHRADVSVDLIASFNKMKTLTTDRSIILSAMEKSTLLQVCVHVYVCLCVCPEMTLHGHSSSFQLSPDRDMVRRVIPLFTPSEDEVTARTVYVVREPVLHVDIINTLFLSCCLSLSHS